MRGLETGVDCVDVPSIRIFENGTIRRDKEDEWKRSNPNEIHPVLIKSHR